MSAVFESRLSDSPHIEIIWRGWVEQDYSPVCPAEVRWNLLFMKHGSQIKVSVEGPTTKTIMKNNSEGAEFLVIRFKLGTFMHNFPINTLVNADAILPQAAGQKFWMNGSAWELPNFENVETFVDRMAHEGLLQNDSVVGSALQEEAPDVSERTLRRRFISATGLTQGAIRQIERAQQAAALLQEGTPILDAVFELGYADQPHLTRSLKRFFGTTPAQLIRVNQAG